MEKLLDRPRAFEESRMRCILAFEAQKRAQILLISNAQRKLVSNFQQKLKSSATMAETHSKWIRDVKAARQKIKLEVERGALEARWSKTRTVCRKARPKTTGASKQERLFLNNDINSVVNLAQYSKDPRQFVKQREVIVNCKREALPKNGNGTHHNRGSEMKELIDVCNSTSHGRVLSDTSRASARYKLWHTDTNLSEACANHGNDDVINRTPFEATLNCFGTCSLEARDGQKLISSSDFGDCEVMHKLDLPEIDGEQNRDDELGTSVSSSRDRLLRKPESVDVSTLNKTGSPMNEDDGTIEVRNGPLEPIECSTSGNYGYVDHHSTSKLIVKPPSSKEKSVYSTRSGRIARQSRELSSDNRSRSGCTVGFHEKKMSYELRSWISNIKKDARKVHSCMEDKSLNAKSKDLAPTNCGMSKKSSVSSNALEKFEAIFRGSYVNEARFENSDYDGRRELVDATALYGKAAVIDSRLDADQKWHKRDPRNKKLKPSILL